MSPSGANLSSYWFCSNSEKENFKEQNVIFYAFSENPAWAEKEMGRYQEGVDEMELHRNQLLSLMSRGAGPNFEGASQTLLTLNCSTSETILQLPNTALSR